MSEAVVEALEKSYIIWINIASFNMISGLNIYPAGYRFSFPDESLALIQTTSSCSNFSLNKYLDRLQVIEYCYCNID